MVLDTFKNCEGLSRIAFFQTDHLVMAGKVVSCQSESEAGAGEVMTAFKKFDQDGNGRISRAELSTVLKRLNPTWNDAELESLMANADKNSDGSLQVEEFVSWLFASGMNA
ncbi:unnamed protein product [Symbiodinium natans]|uniref:EF-hand domain-containing protein n=1 Tax=Symbiodinium natans TaxID=878477 RepID=A0A812U3U6_9DINO|nr:unnamed protein product [Symbiodinium natans]